ncbi:MAG TPA: hypothetical protein VLD67_13560, partial [Vicinamibacterales bacterium]|nr:hypothetical protein [Vicinamibacterales bacterium]
HETGMHLASILVLAGPVDEAVPEKQETVDRRTVQGTVSAVTGKSLTVKTTDGDVVFAINEKTQVVGRGVGTAGRRIEEVGGKTVITDFVAVRDTVRVVYYEKDGTKQALDVNIIAKGSIK